MARGRMINVTIAEDETFNAMSIDAQFIFMRTLPHLDRDGLITGNVILLSSKVAPLLPEYNQKMTGIIQEWIANGFVMRYQDGKRDVLFFINFRKNQFGMRYEKEGVSQFAPPPGYKRTSTGLVPSDTPSNSGNGTNGNFVQDNVSTDEVRPNSVLSAARIEIEVEEKGNNNTCASDDEEPEQPPPPTSLDTQSQSVPEFRDPLPGEYLPGLSNPKRYRLADAVTRFVADAMKLGVTAEQFRLMVDAFLGGCASKPLADAGGERGEQALLFAQEQVLTLCRMDARFRNVGGIESIFTSWRENDYRGNTIPNSKQALEHASKMACNKVVNERSKPGQSTTTQVTAPAPEKINFSMGKLFK